MSEEEDVIYSTPAGVHQLIHDVHSTIKEVGYLVRHTFFNGEAPIVIAQNSETPEQHTSRATCNPGESLSVSILGTSIKSTEEFYSKWREIARMTYRNGFPGISDGTGYSRVTYTSDLGWGCTLRSMQMLICNVLRRCAEDHSGSKTRTSEASIRHILALFSDDGNPDALFSLRKIVSASGREPGVWYGPASISVTLSRMYASILRGDARQRRRVALGGITVLDDFFFSPAILTQVKAALSSEHRTHARPESESANTTPYTIDNTSRNIVDNTSRNIVDSRRDSAVSSVCNEYAAVSHGSSYCVDSSSLGNSCKSEGSPATSYAVVDPISGCGGRDSPASLSSSWQTESPSRSAGPGSPEFAGAVASASCEIAMDETHRPGLGNGDFSDGAENEATDRTYEATGRGLEATGRGLEAIGQVGSSLDRLQPYTSSQLLLFTGRVTPASRIPLSLIEPLVAYMSLPNFVGLLTGPGNECHYIVGWKRLMGSGHPQHADPTSDDDDTPSLARSAMSARRVATPDALSNIRFISVDPHVVQPFVSFANVSRSSFENSHEPCELNPRSLSPTLSIGFLVSNHEELCRLIHSLKRISETSNGFVDVSRVSMGQVSGPESKVWAQALGFS